MSLFDLFKMFLSRETRETASDVIKALKKTPEWKQDIVVIDEVFSLDEMDKSRILVNHMLKLLGAKKWDSDGIQRVQFTLLELIRNAFEHGCKNVLKGKIHIKSEVSSDYLKFEITDPGPGFDLSKELERQGAKNRYSSDCRALGFIYRMTTDLSQEISKKGHKISVTFGKDYNPCEVERIDHVAIFGFKGEIQPQGYFWAEIVREIQELPENFKVILDFSNVEDPSTRILSEIMRLLDQYGWLEGAQIPQGPGVKDYLSTLGKDEREETSKVVVCGCKNINYVLRDFLRTRFKVFPDRNAALEYFNLEC